jgi:hypothetical protein
VHSLWGGGGCLGGRGGVLRAAAGPQAATAAAATIGATSAVACAGGSSSGAGTGTASPRSVSADAGRRTSLRADEHHQGWRRQRRRTIIQPAELGGMAALGDDPGCATVVNINALVICTH